MLKAIAIPADLTASIARMRWSTEDKIFRVLQMVGINTIAYLRSFTARRSPPVRRGEGSRAQHPGGWADVTSNLANAYTWKVTRDEGGATLVLSNSMEYAAYLEARDGFFVLRGVAEPGGPVEQALKEAAAVVAPGWVVRYG